MVRRYFYVISITLVIFLGIFIYFHRDSWWIALPFVFLIAIGLRDSLQKKHTILRNFPLIGHGRYFMEMVRPEIQQYFIDSNIDAYPIEREYRSIVYQRSKKQLDTLPFGTQRDVYRIGYEWASHSIAALPPLEEPPRITIGSKHCSQPYQSSLLNISAMSFGALSCNAIRALNKGAKTGNFAHNTGEGGISKYHLEHGGDLIWQVGTGYFGCRTEKGHFDPELFEEQARQPSVKMIEIKISQGAKPGHGGVLPGVKVTPEIAEARKVKAYETVVSPPGHSAFSNPLELIQFIARLRKLSGGKPVGIKLCIGRMTDFYSICKAIIELDDAPDFITIDGGEGGTGAAPLEFSNSIGMPFRDAMILAHNTLVGANLRDRVKIVASGKILTGFHMVRALALGADVCASARGMMLSLGCIQSLRCNTNHCPTGITTQDPRLIYGLNVSEKFQRVANFHSGTIKGLLELIGAMGLSHPDDLRPHHIYRRVDNMRIRHMAEIYDYLEPGQLIEDGDSLPGEIQKYWQESSAHYWSMKKEQGAHGGDTLRE